MNYPYMILFFKQRGLSTTECAIIFGCLPIVNGLTRQLIGSVADKFQIHKLMTVVACTISPILMNCLLLIPPVETLVSGSSTSLLCSTRNGSLACFNENNSSITGVTSLTNANMFWKQNNISALPDCIATSSFDIGPLCNGETYDEIDILESAEISSFAGVCKVDCFNQMNGPDSVRKDSRFGSTFWMSFCLYFLTFNTYSSLWVLLYAMTYAILGEKRHDFGKQRVWGSIGCILASVISAVTMNKSSTEMNFLPCFIGFTVWILITGTAAAFFKVPHISRNPRIAKDLYKLVRQPQIMLLLVVVFILGFLWGAVETYMFLFLRTLNADSFVLGASIFVRETVEIPALFYSGKVIKKIGHVRCIYIVLLAYVVRYLGPSFITNPWWELPFSCLKTVVFSIGFTAISVYGSAISPPSMHATLQAMVQNLHFGIGNLY